LFLALIIFPIFGRLSSGYELDPPSGSVLDPPSWSVLDPDQYSA